MLPNYDTEVKAKPRKKTMLEPDEVDASGTDATQQQTTTICIDSSPVEHPPSTEHQGEGHHGPLEFGMRAYSYSSGQRVEVSKTRIGHTPCQSDACIHTSTARWAERASYFVLGESRGIEFGYLLGFSKSKLYLHLSPYLSLIYRRSGRKNCVAVS